jgi:two-component system, NtrC family, C4-dicarboxylate transport response regulator DctD
MATTLVMVVEDDANTLSGYLEYLNAAGFAASGVSNGADALSLALENPPAIVVTDITLPGLNGFALTAALHQDTRTRHLPVIGLTGNWDVDIHAKAAACGMRAILAKPCIPAHLVGELERVRASFAVTSERQAS